MPTSSPSTITTYGATTAPGAKPPRTPPPRPPPPTPPPPPPAAHAANLEAIDWCGGIYSSEWGFAKLLHWLRHNPDKRARFATALEHCDMVAAVLCGITDPAQVSRSICAMGHKWMWNARLGGLPPEDFLAGLDPTLAGVRAQLGGRYATSDQIAGYLSEEWAVRLGLRAGIPIPPGALAPH